MTESEAKRYYEQRPKIYPEDERFGQMMCCAVRYALGRMSYVVHDVCDYITPLLPVLSTHSLQNMYRDITERAEVQDLGMEIDAENWMTLRLHIIRELKERGEFNACC